MTKSNEEQELKTNHFQKKVKKPTLEKYFIQTPKTSEPYPIIYNKNINSMELEDMNDLIMEKLHKDKFF